MEDMIIQLYVDDSNKVVTIGARNTETGELFFDVMGKEFSDVIIKKGDRVELIRWRGKYDES